MTSAAGPAQSCRHGLLACGHSAPLLILAIISLLAMFSGAAVAAPIREDCSPLQDGTCDFTSRLGGWQDQPPAAPPSAASAAHKSKLDDRVRQGKTMNLQRTATSRQMPPAPVEHAVPSASATQAHRHYTLQLRTCGNQEHRADFAPASCACCIVLNGCRQRNVHFLVSSSS